MTNGIKRRTFLNRLSFAGMALSMGQAVPGLAHNPSKRKKNEIMVFSKALDWLTDYADLCQIVAETGFDGIELTVRPGGHVLPEKVEDDLPRVVEEAQKAGIKILMITTAISSSNDPLTHRILKTAQEQGIGFYRMGGMSYAPDISVERNMEEFKIKFRELQGINKEYGIHGAYQNHAGGTRFSASIWDLWLVLKDLDPQWIGCQYDSRHAQLEGGAWWPLGMELLSPYIHSTVVKDFKWLADGQNLKVQNCPIGEGAVDFKKHFEQVNKLSIKGPISLHFPYAYLNEGEKLPKKERWKKTVEAMKRKGINPLNEMLAMNN
ncbi:MAG: sugar phosphate isomerase/epimerase family protein [Cyclobacteriaceae bacterium]